MFTCLDLSSSRKSNIYATINKEVPPTIPTSMRSNHQFVWHVIGHWAQVSRSEMKMKKETYE